jgi:hypothetical protein
VWRQFLGAATVTALTATGAGVGATVVLAHAAAASPSQTGGDDLSAWAPNWAWNYTRVFHYQDPNDTNVSINESVTYTNVGVTTFDGQTAYDLALTGSVTGGSGTACSGGTGPSCSGGTAVGLNFTGGSVTGNEYVRVSDQAMLSDQEVQTASGTAESGLVAFTATISTTETPTPTTRTEDFRLHNGDTWTFATSEATTGNLAYSAGSFGSGSSAINTTTVFNGPVTDTAVTKSEPIAANLALDEVAATSTDGTATDQEYWSPTYDNLAEQDVLSNSGGTVESLDRNLVSVSMTPPAKTVTEAFTPNLSCAGGPVIVSGALSTGQSNQPVTVTLDESQVTPGQVVTASATTGSNGAYTATLTAPTLADGLAKAGARGAWGVSVSTGGAFQVATLEVLPQDCDALTYTGTTSAPQGSNAPISALLLDTGTGNPVVGAVVTFSLTGQSGGPITATTGSTGEATTNLAIAGPPRAATITASYAGSATEQPATTTSPLAVTVDPTQVVVSSSEPSATVGDSISFTATVSPTGPTVTAKPTGTVQFTVDGSALGGPTAINAAGVATSISTNTLSIGTHNVVATYIGDANYGGSTSLTFNQIVHKVLIATSTTVVSSQNPTVFGQPTNLTATVTGADGGSPTGQVTFLDGSSSIGTAPLAVSGGSDQASLLVSTLSVGSHTITAIYGTDPNYAQSTSPPIDQTVHQAQTTVTITPSDPSPVAGEPVSFGVTVSPVAPGSGAPTGTVQLSVDGVNSGGPLTLVGGVASLAVGPLTAGTHTIAAVYSADTNFGASNSSLMLNVGQSKTTTVLITAPDPSVSGQAVAFTATVTPVAPGAGNPTGLVNFVEGTTVLGSATLAATVNGDTASIGLATLAVGDHEVQAIYTGDLNYIGSTSVAVDQTVNQAPPVVGTTTVVTASPSNSVFGQPLAFTATVTAQSGTATPTGSVQFSVDGTNLGSAVMVGSAGTAVSPSITTLTAGGHTVVAAYSGDIGFSVSGQVLTVSVRQAASSATITPSQNPAPFHQALTFVATLSAVSPGAGTPGGSVQFEFDGTPLGTPVPVVGGQATSPLVTPTDPGDHTVSIISTGDPNFTPTTASLDVQVGTIPTSTALTANPNPVVYNQPSTLTALVTHTLGVGTPSGAVTFLDGSNTIGTASVVTAAGQQQAVLTISTLAAGVHVITANYSGDTRFGASSSTTPLSVTVQKAPTSLATTAAVIETETVISGLNVHIVLNLLSPPTATLTSNGTPVDGQAVAFTAGTTPLCTALTNAQGVATCAFSASNLVAIVANLGYRASYAGSANYLPIAQNGGLIHTLLNL